MFGYALPPPFMFPGAIYRGNFFRMLNNSAMTQSLAGYTNLGAVYIDSPLALVAAMSRDTLIENNVIELTDRRVINYYRSERPTAFNNVSPGGGRISLYSTPAPGGQYDLDTTVDDRVEEALLCSML
jgi:hypothetical protein